jgi:hypothetical protein
VSCLGIALLLLGVVAVVRSVTATIVSMLFFGWLLVFASGVEIAQAVMVGHWAAAEHHQNGSAFHADPGGSGTGFGATFGISVSIDSVALPTINSGSKSRRISLPCTRR